MSALSQQTLLSHAQHLWCQHTRSHASGLAGSGSRPRGVQGTHRGPDRRPAGAAGASQTRSATRRPRPRWYRAASPSRGAAAPSGPGVGNVWAAQRVYSILCRVSSALHVEVQGRGWQPTVTDDTTVKCQARRCTRGLHSRGHICAPHLGPRGDGPVEAQALEARPGHLALSLAAHQRRDRLGGEGRG